MKAYKIYKNCISEKTNKNLYPNNDSNIFGNAIDNTIITPASDILDFLNPL